MEDRKEIATKLSEFLMLGKNDEIIHGLFDKLNTSQFSSNKSISEINTNNKMIDEEDSIGIWNKNLQKGKEIYQRSFLKRSEWSAWADVHTIPIKDTNRKRILLLGESVARGYFYDPFHSMAKELESILQNTTNSKDIEVVDLAKTSISMDNLVEVLEGSVQLNPDAIILFAGNNWSPELEKRMKGSRYEELFEIINKRSNDDLMSYLEHQFEIIISNFMDRIISFKEKTNIPIVLVVPGYNLQDWKSDDIERIPSLFGQTTAWIKAKELMEIALEEGDMETVENQSRQMIDFDPSNPLGYELLAECQIHKGQITDAIYTLDRAKDTVLISRNSDSKPRCFKIVRETLIKKGYSAQFKIVDIFSLFKELFPQKVPGRELYLDYCHLTIKGIKIAMKYTGRALLESINNQSLDIKLVKNSSVVLSKKVLGMAHFCAAIHNAHYGQREDIIYYHCQIALLLDKNIKSIMLLFVDLSTRRTTSIFCKSFESIVMSGAMRQYESGKGLLHPNKKKLMDVSLTNSIIKALNEYRYDYTNELNRLRIQEHGVGNNKISLLESFYSLNSYNNFYNSKEASYMSIRTRNKKFVFVPSLDKDLSFCLVYRTRFVTEDRNALKIFLNDKKSLVANFPASKEWSYVKFIILSESLVKGINEIILEWPANIGQLNKITLKNYTDVINTFFPVNGDIFSFTVQNI